jgi:hypothetical protein
VEEEKERRREEGTEGGTEGGRNRGRDGGREGRREGGPDLDRDHVRARLYAGLSEASVIVKIVDRGS